MLARYMLSVRLPVCLSVRLPVCLSVRHKRVLYRNDWTNQANFWHLSFFPPLCCKEIRRSPKITELPSEILPQMHLENFATASRSCCQQSSSIEISTYANNLLTLSAYTLRYALCYSSLIFFNEVLHAFEPERLMPPINGGTDVARNAKVEINCSNVNDKLLFRSFRVIIFRCHATSRLFCVSYVVVMWFPSVQDDWKNCPSIHVVPAGLCEWAWVSSFLTVQQYIVGNSVQYSQPYDIMRRGDWKCETWKCGTNLQGWKMREKLVLKAKVWKSVSK